MALARLVAEDAASKAVGAKRNEVASERSALTDYISSTRRSVREGTSIASEDRTAMLDALLDSMTWMADNTDAPAEAIKEHAVALKSKCESLSTKHAVAVEERILAAFKASDRNKDGFISRKELAALFEHQNWSAQDLDEMMQVLDTNKDGLIDYEEFVHWIMTGEQKCASAREAKPVGKMETFASDPKDATCLPVQRRDVKYAIVVDANGQAIDPNKEPASSSYPLQVQMVVEVRPVQCCIEEVCMSFPSGSSCETAFEDELRRLGFDGRLRAEVRPEDVKSMRTFDKDSEEVDPRVRPHPDRFPLQIQMSVLAKSLGPARCVPLQFCIKEPSGGCRALVEAFRQHGIVF